MLVLHVYSGNLYGGIESLLITLSKERGACPGMGPHFALSYDGWLRDRLEETEARVFRLAGVRIRNPMSVRRSRRDLRALLQSTRYDMVICHGFWSLAIYGPAVRSAGVPLVLWQHAAASGLHWLEMWARRTRPDLAICNSRFTAATVPRLFPGLPSEVVYSPLSLQTHHYSDDDRRAVREQLETPQDATVIVQVSRLERWKGHELHLDALGRIADDPRWVCWIVGRAQQAGEEAYLESLRSRALKLGISERIRFVGWWPDLPRLLHSADIFCQPNSGPEPLGLTFLEALWSRLPVVSTAMGGAREIVTAECGELVEPGDATALAETLRRLVGDPERRVALGRRGPERVLQLSDPECQIALLGRVLNGLTGSRGDRHVAV